MKTITVAERDDNFAPAVARDLFSFIYNTTNSIVRFPTRYKYKFYPKFYPRVRLRKEMAQLITSCTVRLKTVQLRSFRLLILVQHLGHRQKCPVSIIFHACMSVAGTAPGPRRRRVRLRPGSRSNFGALLRAAPGGYSVLHRSALHLVCTRNS